MSRQQPASTAHPSFLVYKKDGERMDLHRSLTPPQFVDYVFSDTDQRVVVSCPSAIPPYRHICAIQAHFGSSTRYGTGWMAAEGLLMTAAHVVHDSESGADAQSVTIIPARDGSDERYPRITLPTKGHLRLPEKNPVQGSAEDYAALLLPRGQWPGVGFFGWKPYDEEFLSRQVVYLAGYPDTALTDDLFHDRQVYHRGRVACEPQLLRYLIDTDEGQSGSPLWIDLGSGVHMAIGIHVGVRGGSNVAVRLNERVFEFMDKL